MRREVGRGSLNTLLYKLFFLRSHMQAPNFKLPFFLLTALCCATLVGGRPCQGVEAVSQHKHTKLAATGSIKGC